MVCLFMTTVLSVYNSVCMFRSTPRSQPIKASFNVRPSVLCYRQADVSTQKVFFDSNEIWSVARSH